MQPLKVIGEIDQQGRLTAMVPGSLPPGLVEVLVLARPVSEDEAGLNWMAGVAREWTEELNDPREDIYSITDGVPVDASR